MLRTQKRQHKADRGRSSYADDRELDPMLSGTTNGNNGFCPGLFRARDTPTGQGLWQRPIITGP